MKDCSHHYDKSLTPYEIFKRFMQSREGKEWYIQSLQWQARHPVEHEKGCFKGEEF